MKNITLLSSIAGCLMAACCSAQDIKAAKVPAVVKAAVSSKYPGATNISWEMEAGNYEANWGGKSGEDSSAAFSPAGAFVQIVLAIPVGQLPAAVAPWVKLHYNGAKVKEAGRVTDAQGKLSYEAEVKGKDLIFDDAGNFVREDAD